MAIKAQLIKFCSVSLIFSQMVLNIGLADENYFTLRLPKHSTTNHSTNRTRNFLNYMAASFMDPQTGGFVTSDSELQGSEELVLIPKSSISRHLWPTFDQVSNATSPLESFQILKRLISSENYWTARKLHHSHFPVYDTVRELENFYHFTDWPSECVSPSSVKGSDRVLYKSPSHFPKISIAQTVVKNSRFVRETEMIIEREYSQGQFDFYAYNSQGNLSLTSTFHTSKGKDITAPVPYTCLTCHYSALSSNSQNYSPVSRN